MKSQFVVIFLSYAQSTNSTFYVAHLNEQRMLNRDYSITYLCMLDPLAEKHFFLNKMLSVSSSNFSIRNLSTRAT